MDFSDRRILKEKGPKMSKMAARMPILPKCFNQALLRGSTPPKRGVFPFISRENHFFSVYFMRKTFLKSFFQKIGKNRHFSLKIVKNRLFRDGCLFGKNPDFSMVLTLLEHIDTFLLSSLKIFYLLKLKSFKTINRKHL